MKNYFKLLLFVSILNFVSCSSSEEKDGYETVEADAKAEVSLSINDFDIAIQDESYSKSLDGKVVEITGKVIKTYSISENGDASKGAHYIEIEGEEVDLVKPTIMCFFGSSQESLMGKTVTVKGHFFNDKGYTGIMHCIAK
jgi:hypothetical protein